MVNMEHIIRYKQATYTADAIGSFVDNGTVDGFNVCTQFARPADLPSLKKFFGIVSTPLFLTGLILFRVCHSPGLVFGIDFFGVTFLPLLSSPCCQFFSLFTLGVTLAIAAISLSRQFFVSFGVGSSPLSCALFVFVLMSKVVLSSILPLSFFILRHRLALVNETTYPDADIIPYPIRYYLTFEAAT